MKLKEIWTRLWESLYPTTAKGFSIKNIMASVTHISLLVLTFKWTDTNNLLMVLTLWIGFITLLMGLRTYEKKQEINEPILPTPNA